MPSPLAITTRFDSVRPPVDVEGLWITVVLVLPRDLLIRCDDGEGARLAV